MNLDYKPDALAYKNIELLKENRPNMKVKLGWMEEYSQLNKQQDIYNITKLKRSPSIFDKNLNKTNRFCQINCVI